MTFQNFVYGLLTFRPPQPQITPRLDLVNMVVRPLLYTKSSLFTKLSLDKEQNMKKGAGFIHYIEYYFTKSRFTKLRLECT